MHKRMAWKRPHRTRPLMLDLCCGEGGAAIGYHRAGFDVVGVDIYDMPRYPFPFIRADIRKLPFDVHDFDAIHASPPCKAHTPLRVLWNTEHESLIGVVADIMRGFDGPTVVENVVGSWLPGAHTICGSSLGCTLRLPQGNYYLRRHRLFQTNFPLTVLPCACADYKKRGYRIIGVYGHGNQLYNTNVRDSTRKAVPPSVSGMTMKNLRRIMGVEHASALEMSQAIPPVYTEWVGRQMMAHLLQSVA